MARHLPCPVRADAAPPRGACRAGVNFTILDTDDQIRLLKQVMEAERIDTKRWVPAALMGVIQRWKDRGLTPARITPNEDSDFANGRAQALYAAYQERLRTLNAADFGDLILHMTEILRTQPDILADYHRRFRYILVDEYQDTNLVQYLWLRLLAQGHRNICCVGDDDQSIYSWRGAEVENILRFEKDFEGAKIVRLESNYRSTASILAAASGLIAHNEGRLGKTLRPGRGRCPGRRKGHRHRTVGLRRGSPHGRRQDRGTAARRPSPGRDGRPGPCRFPDARVRGTADHRRCAVSRGGWPALLRTRRNPRRHRLYARHGAAGRRPGVRAHRQCASARGWRLGVEDDARSRPRWGIPLQAAAARLVETGGLKGKLKEAIGGLLRQFGHWRKMLEGDGHVVTVATMLDESGYTEMWKQDKSAEAPGRLENLKELVRALADFETLAGFLDHVALVMENEDRSDTDKVSLMTLHGAKGLEFDTVFLPGWEDGVFPNQRSMDESGNKGLEEERRLAYVGLTRARKRAIVSHAANRRIYANWQVSTPSRFLDELPEAHVEQTGGIEGGSHQCGDVVLWPVPADRAPAAGHRSVGAAGAVPPGPTRFRWARGYSTRNSVTARSTRSMTTNSTCISKHPATSACSTALWSVRERDHLRPQAGRRESRDQI